MPTFRTPLKGLSPVACDHPWLALQHLAPFATEDELSRATKDEKQRISSERFDLIEKVSRGTRAIEIIATYKSAFTRRYKALDGFTGGIAGAVTHFYSLPVQGRLAAGLGNASVLENGLSLNHTYGLPYLPGTGLKGMASAMAHLGLDAESWQRGKEVNGKWTRQGTDHKVLFGTMDTGAEDAAAGMVIFHDAWWDPAPDKVPAKRLPFEPDVMTPHHQKYNMDGADWPNDWESPIPVPYMTVSGTFRLALTGPAEWVEAAFEILKMAFLHLGFGAKTQIGYGRGELSLLESEEEKAARLRKETDAVALAREQAAAIEAAAKARLLADIEAVKTEYIGSLWLVSFQEKTFELEVAGASPVTFEAKLPGNFLEKWVGPRWRDWLAVPRKRSAGPAMAVKVMGAIIGEELHVISLRKP